MLYLLFLLAYVFLVILGTFGLMLLIQFIFYQFFDINLYKIIMHLVEIGIKK